MWIAVGNTNHSEKDVEGWLYAHPETVRLGTSWQVKQWIGRQYKLPSGIADLIGVNEDGTVVVVEIKNVPADARAIAQVCRYAEDVRAILDRRESYSWRNGQGAIVLRVVIAPSVESVYTHFE